MSDRISDRELHRLAARAREREGLRLTRAVVKARRMSRRDIRRAKNRQDHHLLLKGVAVAIQTICVLLICFLGLLAFHEMNYDTESAFYSTQLVIEIVLLLGVFTVLLFETYGLRLILIFLFILAFIENILHVIYYLLFDKNSTMCRKVELAFGNSVCVTPHLPIDHHSSFASGILALFHFMLALLALGIATSYDGTISEIVNSTDPELLVIHHRMHRKAKKASSRLQPRASISRRSLRRTSPSQSLRKDSRKTTQVSYAGLDITKLPEGTKFKTCSDRTFNMEYCVENGVFVGTRTEKTNKTINIRAPTRPPRIGEPSPKLPSTSETSRSSHVDRNSIKRQDARSFQTTFTPK